MRTKPRAETLRIDGERVTKQGRSGGPSNGAHSTASPFSFATDVNAPHSWAASGAVSVFNSAANKTVAAAAKPIAVLSRGMFVSPCAHWTQRAPVFFPRPFPGVLGRWYTV